MFLYLVEWLESGCRREECDTKEQAVTMARSVLRRLGAPSAVGVTLVSSNDGWVTADRADVNFRVIS